MQPVILIHSLGLDLCILCLDVENKTPGMLLINATNRLKASSFPSENT